MTQIETKLSESMKTKFKDAEPSYAEAKETLVSARYPEAEELPVIHGTTFLNDESVRIDGGSRAAKH